MFRIRFDNAINVIPKISNPWGISLNNIIAYIIALAGSMYDIVDAFCALILIRPSIYRNSAIAVWIIPNVRSKMMLFIITSRSTNSSGDNIIADMIICVPTIVRLE